MSDAEKTSCAYSLMMIHPCDGSSVLWAAYNMGLVQGTRYVPSYNQNGSLVPLSWILKKHALDQISGWHMSSWDPLNSGR